MNTNNTKTQRYEGQLKNGKRNGYGKVYSAYGRLIFEGEFEDGKRNGYGKTYFADGSSSQYYEGEWKDNELVRFFCIK